MGSFAAKFLPTMSLQELQAYERILSRETVDLFHYLSGQTPVPEVSRQRTVGRVVAGVQESGIFVSDEERRKSPTLRCSCLKTH